MIEAILFDSSGTLMNAQPSYSKLWVKAFEKRGITLDDAVLAQAFKTARSNDQHRYGETDAGNPNPTWFRDSNRDVLAATGLLEDTESMLETLEEVLNTPSNWRVFPDVVPILSKLKADGYKLGVISNWDWRLPELLDNMGLGEYFQATISSSTAGFPKPRPQVYYHALEAIGSLAERTIYIGDTYDSDIVGALRAGLHAVFLDRTRRFNYDTLTISTFEDLEAAILRM